MADSTPAVLTDLAAARALLVPQIKGLKDLAATGVSPDLKDALDAEIQIQTRRLGLIDAAHAAIVALQDDGYPIVAPSSVPASLFSELEEEQAAIAAAVAMFVEQASAMTVNLSPPKPQVPIASDKG
jgi:hypothetical protein